LQLSGAETSQVARAKLRVTLCSLTGSNYEQVHSAVAHLLGVDAEPGQSNPTATDPRALRSQLILALRSIVEALTARGPFTLIVEDLHWADRATIEILIVLSELTDFLPLMILVTSRPEHDRGSWDFRVPCATKLFPSPDGAHVGPTFGR
jgi:predicted ATPase